MTSRVDSCLGGVTPIMPTMRAGMAASVACSSLGIAQLSGHGFAKAVLEGCSLDLLELDLAAHHLGLPGFVRSVMALELRHHLFGEQLERLADVLVRVLAGLVEQYDLVDVGGLEL